MDHELKTNRLLLRRFEENDLKKVFQGLSHPEVIKYYGISFDSEEGTKEQMKWFRELEEQGTGFWWAICSDEKEFLGAAGFNNWSKEHRKAEIGYWLLPEFWGQGIVQETLPVICKYAFEEFDLHRIEALVEAGNGKSVKVLEKQGFRREGTMIDYEIKNGEFITVHLFAKLKSE